MSIIGWRAYEERPESSWIEDLVKGQHMARNPVNDSYQHVDFPKRARPNPLNSSYNPFTHDYAIDPTMIVGEKEANNSNWV